MSYLYVCEQGAVIGIAGNRCQVKCKGEILQSMPIETLEVIEIFGNIQMTTQCMVECLKRGITVVFYSMFGAYYGRLISTGHVNVARQRRQAAIEQNEVFKLELSKKLIDAKIRNQIVILRRYARYGEYDIERRIDEMQYLNRKATRSITSEQLMGYEGSAARLYFKTLGELIRPEFAFDKRTKRPPRDPFNSMISLGYSVVLNELYGKLEAKGLNPYFGVLHKDREMHPALASDLMEEWRAVLIDSIVLSMLNGRELLVEDFYKDPENLGVYLTGSGFKKYVQKLENKFRSKHKYLSYIDYEVSFRNAMELQIGRYIKAIESEDVELYCPIIIR